MKNIKRILWGAAIAALGVIIGLNSFGVADINIFFDGWWTLFIIVPSFLGLFERDGRLVSLVFLLAGIALLLEAQDILSWELISKLIVPVILVLVGLSIIFKDVFKDKAAAKIKELKNENPDYSGKEFSALFSGQNLSFDGQVFDGCRLSAIFGGIKCDLSRAVIEKDAVIEAEGIFGGVDIILPQDVNCVISSNSIFGGVSDKRKKTAPDSAPTVYIKGTAIFGGVDVK